MRSVSVSCAYVKGHNSPRQRNRQAVARGWRQMACSEELMTRHGIIKVRRHVAVRSDVGVRIYEIEKRAHTLLKSMHRSSRSCNTPTVMQTLVANNLLTSVAILLT